MTSSRRAHRLSVAFLILGLFAGEPTPGHAQAPPRTDKPERVRDLRTGQLYAAGTRVRAPLLGISFVVPDGWRARLRAGAGVVGLESVKHPGVGVVQLLQDMTADGVEARLREPQAFDESFVLHPVDLLLGDGSTWLATYTGGEVFGSAAALLGPGRRAAIYLFAGPGEEAASHGELLARLTASTRFEREEDAALLKEWYPRLAGMALTSHATGSKPGPGIRVWHLCHDGTFHFARFRGSEARAGAAVEEAAGDWRVEADGARAVLMLSSETGAVTPLTLSPAGGQPALDGEPVSSAVSDVCP